MFLLFVTWYFMADGYRLMALYRREFDKETRVCYNK